MFPAAALSDTDAMSDSSTASNISAESPPPPGTAQQLIVLLILCYRIYSCPDESPAAAPAEKKPSFVLWNAWTDNCRGRSEEEEGEGEQGVARIKQEAGEQEEEADRNSEEEAGGGISTVQSPSPNTTVML